MADLIVSIIAIILYIVAGIMLVNRLRVRDTGIESKRLPLFVGMAAVALHAFVLFNDIVTPAGINVGFTNMSSLSTWFVTGLLVVTSLNKPVENLGILILPIAAAILSFELAYPTVHLLEGQEHRGLGLHILFSILAYSLLGLAAVQAILLSVQERQLHNRQPGGFIRALPPMETMENLLFQMIIIGFVLQTMSLTSGFVYLEDMFAQHLVHKTVLSGIAWLVFAVLLYGHWQFGWRGRTAVRWTLSGFSPCYSPISAVNMSLRSSWNVKRQIAQKLYCCPNRNNQL